MPKLQRNPQGTFSLNFPRDIIKALDWVQGDEIHITIEGQNLIILSNTSTYDPEMIQFFKDHDKLYQAHDELNRLASIGDTVELNYRISELVKAGYMAEPSTKKRRNEWHKKYYQKHKDKIKEYQHRPDVAARRRAYQREYYHRDYAKAKKSKYMASDRVKEMRKKSYRKWYEKNKEKVKEYQRRYREKKKMR